MSSPAWQMAAPGSPETQKHRRQQPGEELQVPAARGLWAEAPPLPCEWAQAWLLETQPSA